MPVFALLAAGVPLSLATLARRSPTRSRIGVVAGLVVGKLVGVFGGSWLTARFTRAELAGDLRWREVASVSLLAGSGFTVALLIADLAFEGDRNLQERPRPRS